MRRRKKNAGFIQTVSVVEYTQESRGIPRMNKYLQSPEGIYNKVMRELEICRLESHRPSSPSKKTLGELKSIYGLSESKIDFSDPSKWQVHTSLLKPEMDVVPVCEKTNGPV
jgi:hypothetical protein